LDKAVAARVVTWSRHNARYWSGLVEYYDGMYVSRWSKLEDELVASILATEAIRCGAPDAVVLDVGCGSGLGLELVREDSARYIGLDISRRSLLLLRSAKPHVPVVCADGGAFLPFADSSVDVVISIFTSFSYVPDWKLGLTEFGRVLRPGGSIYLSTLGRTSLRRMLKLRFSRIERYRTRGSSSSNSHALAWTFSRREMKGALAHAGFTDVRHHPIGVLGGVLEAPGFWRLDRRLCSIVPALAHMSDWSARAAGRSQDVSASRPTERTAL
jgi:SAM-dependent methyltransferase